MIVCAVPGTSSAHAQIEQKNSPEQSAKCDRAASRGTMGTLLYACMTLIGRETDRLTHLGSISLISRPRN
jgi:CRISPR-associated protein (TIGR02584 family)